MSSLFCAAGSTILSWQVVGVILRLEFGLIRMCAKSLSFILDTGCGGWQYSKYEGTEAETNASVEAVKQIMHFQLFMWE